jgi:hypothetical protein
LQTASKEAKRFDGRKEDSHKGFAFDTIDSELDASIHMGSAFRYLESSVSKRSKCQKQKKQECRKSDKFCSQWLNGALLPPRRAGLSSMMLFFVTERKENETKTRMYYEPIDPTFLRFIYLKGAAIMGKNEDEKTTVRKWMDDCSGEFFFELKPNLGQALYSIGALNTCRVLL